MLENISDPIFLTSQVSMLVATTLVFASYQFKKGETFRWLFVIAGVFAALHFALLGAVTASVIVVINSLRWLVSIFSKTNTFLYFFIILMIGTSFFTYENIYSLIPLTAGIIATFAIFHKNELRTREMLLIVGLMWLTYNSIIFSPMGIVSEILFFLSGVVGYLRLKSSRHGEVKVK